MFEPNNVGWLSRKIGRNVHAQVTYAPPVKCPFAPVNLSVGAQKTSVRADSSASRGAADEMAAMRAKILVANFVKIEIGDRFEFDGQTYRIETKHTRRSVAGVIDHFECDMELLP
ncbi:hypothetical protein [Ancylobacter rudongensis]|uniref:Phage head-tail joining protein n=1 Tax=Ancylobacter rudongensis TaxID=177413 RepID=A0A1G4UQ20_9HYPH|nr:hypothetical protein [Ancylobacter rudongensis]SCW95647.1 hypothetical protein SAMN05660859_0076 [Ancylobacter rudongensis]